MPRTGEEKARRSRQTAGRQGFTRIESLIVIIAIGILAAVAIPMYLSQNDVAKEAAIKEGVHNIQIAAASHAADHCGAYAATQYVTLTAERSVDSPGNCSLDVCPTNPWTGQPMTSAFMASMYTAPHDIKISAVGAHNVVKVDGVSVMTFGDSTYWTGSSELRAWYGEPRRRRVRRRPAEYLRWLGRLDGRQRPLDPHQQ